MYNFLIVIYIIACFILIAVILLQAGRGGGLSEAFGGGGGMDRTIFGTPTTTFLTRITAIAGIIFILISLSLAAMSRRRSKSLIGLEKVEDTLIEETKEREEVTFPEEDVGGPIGE